MGGRDGAGDEIRTRDSLLGKQVLYQLSYSRLLVAVYAALTAKPTAPSVGLTYQCSHATQKEVPVTDSQNSPITVSQSALSVAGRVLLALYFLVPGIMKVVDFDGTAAYMAAHGMVAIPFFLGLTIVLQIGGALCLAVGYRIQLTAFILAGLVLVISIVMHNFWAMEAGVQQAHEMQNFIKNMAVMAGLMVLAGGTGPLNWSLFKRTLPPT